MVGVRRWQEIPPDVLAVLRRGTVIPAHLLALDARRRLDARRQRALTRYYLDAGAGGIAVGVHATQFAIREVGLYEPVLKLAVDTVAEWTKRPIVLIAGGLAMLLSALYPRFRDVQPIWEVVLQVAFYGSPILYVLEMLPSLTLQHLVIWFNPLATILVQARHWLIDPSAPTAWEAAGGFVYLLIPTAIVFFAVAAGLGWIGNRFWPEDGMHNPLL